MLVKMVKLRFKEVCWDSFVKKNVGKTNVVRIRSLGVTQSGQWRHFWWKFLSPFRFFYVWTWLNRWISFHISRKNWTCNKFLIQWDTEPFFVVFIKFFSISFFIYQVLLLFRLFVRLINCKANNKKAMYFLSLSFYSILWIWNNFD